MCIQISYVWVDSNRARERERTTQKKAQQNKKTKRSNVNEIKEASKIDVVGLGGRRRDWRTKQRLRTHTETDREWAMKIGFKTYN